MKKYFVIFIIEKEEEDIFKNDIVEFEEIKRFYPVKKLEEYLLRKWGDHNKDNVTIIDYREI